MNYRADRAKEILSTIVNSNSFQEFMVEDMSNVDVFSFFNVDKKIKLNNGLEIPCIGLGTYQIRKKSEIENVIKIGYNNNNYKSKE